MPLQRLSNIVTILSNVLTKVIPMCISLFALSLCVIGAIEACPHEEKNTTTKIKGEKLLIAPVFFF